MQAVHFLSGWDTAILIVPFFGLLALWMFGLDERVAAPRDRSARRRFCYTDPNGQSQFCDPDGRIPTPRRITPLRTRPSAGNSAPASMIKGELCGQAVFGYLTESTKDTSGPVDSAAAQEFH